MSVNPNEAPEGFLAVEVADGAPCDGCAVGFLSPECLRIDCVGVCRQDGCYVIFVPRSDSPATANWPYDSEGTPV